MVIIAPILLEPLQRTESVVLTATVMAGLIQIVRGVST